MFCRKMKNIIHKVIEKTKDFIKSKSKLNMRTFNDLHYIIGQAKFFHSTFYQKFLTKILILDLNFDYQPKFILRKKLSFFLEKSRTCPKLIIISHLSILKKFRNPFLTKISVINNESSILGNL